MGLGDMFVYFTGLPVYVFILFKFNSSPHYVLGILFVLIFDLLYFNLFMGNTTLTHLQLYHYLNLYLKRRWWWDV